MKKLYALLAVLSLVHFFAGAQTPGVIIRDGAGNIPPTVRSTVLDPNQDGLTSKTAAGFVGGDVGASYSEIPYKPVPIIYGEPTADLSRGPVGAFTELVKDANGVGMYLYYDGTNFLCRLRVGSIMAGSKGYSIMLDTDGKFGPTGPNADPTYQEATTGTNGNPGFEYEIVYETNFRVAVYFVDNACGSFPLPIATYDLASNPGQAQTSVALTTDSDDPDYFYDFWIPRTALAQPGFVVGPTTPLRAITTTVMSPQGAICGPKSDVYGDDTKFSNPQQQYIGVIGSQPPFTLEDISVTGGGVKPPCTASPTVNYPIAVTATSITGTWTKAAYSTETVATINVYKGGSLLGTTTTTSGATWTLSGITVSANDVITAFAVSAGESSCNPSNAVQVLACTPATSSVCPTVTCFSRRGAEGTAIAGATLRIYQVTGTGRTEVFNIVVPAGGAWGWAGPGSTGNSTSVCGTGTTDVPDGVYVVTQQETGKCESIGCTNSVVNLTCSVTAPTIDQQVVYTGTATLSGTATTGNQVSLYINNLLKTSATVASGVFSFPLSGYYLNLNDVITLTQTASNGCVSAPTSRTVQCYVSAPIINADASQRIAIGSQISGTSAEPQGTTVTVYNGATDAVIGSTAVQADGSWLLSTPVATTGTTYYARHTATACGSSVSSSTVSTLAATSSARCGTIASPVLESASSVSGTLSSGGISTTVRLFVDGVEIGNTTTSVAAWSIPVNTTVFDRIYAGGVLSISIAEGANLAAACTGNTVQVSCVPPAAPALGFSVATPRLLTNSTGVLTADVTNSQAGVYYFIELDPSNTTQPSLADGFSLVGNGGTIQLSSSAIITPGNYTLRVTAVKPGFSCQSTTSFALIVADNDNDGVADYLDNDDDNDGILDTDEGGGTGVSLDSDNDGVINFRDPDYCTLNANGVCVSLDKDGDGIINQLDLDSDNDGVVDVLEAGGNDANGDGKVDSFTDTDGDGLTDQYDTDNGGTAISNFDSDSDGFANAYDLDSDNDGIVDNIEAQSTGGYTAPGGNDSDGDGIDDAYDNDAGPGRAIAGVDTDGDGTADYRDADSDNDAKPDTIEGWDTDGNGVIDGAEKSGGSADSDNDGILDGWDNNIGSSNVTNGTNPTSYPDVNNPGGDRDWRDSYITISGKLWNDANGDKVKGAGESFLSGSATAGSGAVTSGGPLYINIVDLGTGQVVNVIQPGTTGQFSLQGLVANTNYRAILSTTLYSVGAIAPTTPQLPAGWASVGEDRNGTPEATTPGIIDFNTNFNAGNPTASLSQLNQGFGLNQIPTTIAVNALLSGKMLINTNYSLASNPFTGTDPEDGPGAAPIQDGATFQVTSLPNSADATLYYNGVPVTVNQTISNFDSDLLEIRFLRIETGPGVPLSGTSFEYRIVDAAGTPGNTATYDISLSTILPVTGLHLKGGYSNNLVNLNWTTLTERNASKFLIERSSDGNSFTTIGIVAASGNSDVVQAYQFEDRGLNSTTGYYRVRLIDKNGAHVNSNTISVRMKAFDVFQIYPNPAKERVYISVTRTGMVNVELMNSAGMLLWSANENVVSAGSTIAIPRNGLPSGIYLIRVRNAADGSSTVDKVCFE